MPPSPIYHQNYIFHFRYQVVDGNHRLKAILTSREGTFSHILCNVYTGLTPQQSLCLGYVRNTQAANVLKMDDIATVELIRKMFHYQVPRDVTGKNDQSLETIYKMLGVTEVCVQSLNM